MTFDKYKGQMAALLIAEAFDAIKNCCGPDSACCPIKVFQMHWQLANWVLQCDTVGEVRDCMYWNGFEYFSQLHMKNIHYAFPDLYSKLS